MLLCSPAWQCAHDIGTDTISGKSSRIRSSIFHPTRTAGGVNVSSSTAHTLTFKNIFGRGTLLAEPNGTENDHHYHDLTPLTSDVSSIKTSAVTASSAYTNGKYTITDPNNLKQKVKKQKYDESSGKYVRYKDWVVKVVSMEARITSLKVIWKHVRVIPQQPSLWKCEHLTFSSPPVCCVGH